jgi:uncharacterized protein (TIGR03083 family)
VSVQHLVREERADFAAFLATLTPEQWQAPTLCTRWRVRDVVAHVISYDDLDTRALLVLASRRRFRSARINAAALARYDTNSPEQLLALLAGRLQPRGLPGALGGRVALVETLIHHQDIRRALGRPRTVPAERLLPALRTALIAPDIGGYWRIRGIRLAATDLDFAAGLGPGVRGAAEVLLMAIAGRRGVVRELSLVHSALDPPARLDPVGELAPGGQGVRVLRAEDPLAHRQQRGEQVPSGGRVPGQPGKTGQVGTERQGIGVLGA